MDKQKFLGAGGVRLVLSLFYEYRHLVKNDTAVYTLSNTDKEVDGKVYPSLFRLYMETADITEGAFVEKYLYDWKQWELLQQNKILAPYIEMWRTELRKKVRSEMMGVVYRDALNPESKTATTSAKYILEYLEKEEPKESSKKQPGRPSNKRTLGITNIPEKKILMDDAKRVFGKQ